jgi:hypothetical protein
MPNHTDVVSVGADRGNVPRLHQTDAAGMRLHPKTLRPGKAEHVAASGFTSGDSKAFPLVPPGILVRTFFGYPSVILRLFEQLTSYFPLLTEWLPKDNRRI